MERERQEPTRAEILAALMRGQNCVLCGLAIEGPPDTLERGTFRPIHAACVNFAVEDLPQ